MSGRDRIISFEVLFFQIPAQPEFRGTGENEKVLLGSRRRVGGSGQMDLKSEHNFGQAGGGQVQMDKHDILGYAVAL